MIVLGIDPGKSGGLALISGARSQRPKIIKCIAVPVAPPGSDDLLDVNAIIAFIQSCPPDVGYIERVTPMPSDDDSITHKRRGMGSTSAFNFGGAVYTIRTCVVGLGIQLKRIEVAHWKKAHGISSKDPATGHRLDQRKVKELSRQKAIALFGADHFPLIGDHNKAEAALIANYGRMRENGA